MNKWEGSMMEAEEKKELSISYFLNSYRNYIGENVKAAQRGNERAYMHPFLLIKGTK